MDGETIPNLKELIETPARKLNIELKEEEIQQIIKFSGTIPFFAQAIASSWVHDRRAGKITARELFKHLIANLSSYFAQWWQQFSDIEREVLKISASQQSLATAPFSAADVADAVHGLKNFAFLLENKGQFIPNGEIFRFWLQHLPGKSVKRLVRTKNSEKTNDQVSKPVDFIRQSNELIELLPVYQKIILNFKIQDLQPHLF